jgi:hypothetical protein
MNFDDYIQQLLGNRNPQGNMLTGVSTTPNFYNQAQNNDYYNNPYRQQDSIDAAMAKKLADEQALAQQLGIPNAGGMMSGGGGGDSEVSLTPDQIAYFDAETGMERDARMNNIFNGITAPIAGLLGGPIGYSLAGLMPNNAPVYSGRNDYSTRSPDAIRQQIQAEQAQAAQAAAQAAVNAQAKAIPVDPGIRAAINAQARAAAQASNVAEGGGGYSGPGGVGGSGVSEGGGRAAGGFGIGGW